MCEFLSFPFALAPWTENEWKAIEFPDSGGKRNQKFGGHSGGPYLTQTLNAALIRSSAIPLSHMQIPSTPVPE